MMQRKQLHHLGRMDMVLVVLVSVQSKRKMVKVLERIAKAKRVWIRLKKEQSVVMMKG